MGSTYGPCKKEVQLNTNLRRFLHRVKRSPLSSPKPWRNFQLIKWWKNLPQNWPSRRISSDRGGWRKFQISIKFHRGLYKYTRLTFGVKAAPAIFQQVMDTMLGDLDYATAYLDDILVTSKTTAEHRNHIINVFEKLPEYEFKVKEAKCDFFFTWDQILG